MALQKNLKGFWKRWGKRIKGWFSLFHNVFFPIFDRNDYLHKVKIVVCKCFQFGKGQNIGNQLNINLSSANAFNLVKAKIFLFGKELMHLPDPLYQEGHDIIMDQ